MSCGLSITIKDYHNGGGDLTLRDYAGDGAFGANFIENECSSAERKSFRPKKENKEYL